MVNNGLSGVISSTDHPDDEIKVTLDEPKPEAPTEPEAPTANLVGKFKADELKKIASRCLEDYESDIEARTGHMRMLRKWYELYAGISKTKDWPFQKAANVSIPALTWTLLQISGRIYDAILPEKGDILSVVPARAEDPAEIDRCTRTELYSNAYIRDRVPEFRPSYDKTIWQMCTFGSTFRYGYWDMLEDRLRTDSIPIDDFVVPYRCRSSDPLMRDVPRYTYVRHLTLFEIQDRAEVGEFDQAVVDTLKPGLGKRTDKKSEFKQTVEQVDGVSEPTTQSFLEDEERDVYQQHRWLRLPKDPARHPLFDGKPHPVKICIDETEEKVLSVMPMEEDDPTDARRFVKEKGAFDQATQAHQAFEASGGMTVDPQSGAPVPMPPPPELPPEPKPVRQRQLCLFTHWKAFEGEGFYGLGFGHFIGPLNEAMNTMFNQQIDRSTVNNAGGGIISRQMRFQRGAIDRQPGKYVEVDAPASAIKDGLQNWPMVPADPDGRWFVQMLEGWANRTSGAGDTLSGEPIGSNETARAAMARFEQATKQISILASRTLSYMTADFRIDWSLFAVHLDEQEYVDLVDSQGKARGINIGRADFQPDAKVTPTADPRIGSRAQRISEAQDALNFLTAPTAPLELSQNPAVRRSVIERVLRAMDMHEMIDLLGPPPGPPQPPQPKPQWDENAGFLKDQDQPVNPQDDDDAHLLEIQNFKQDPLGYEKLSPTGRKMLDNHERGHLAQSLTKTRQAHEQQAAAVGGPPGGAPPGMAPAPGNGPPGGLPPGQGQ
jgi:hypothetical protein